MLEITAKDRLFAAVAIPLLLLAAYLFLIRHPLARDVAAMRARLATLGSVDTLRAERATLDRRLAEARTSLATAEADPDDDTSHSSLVTCPSSLPSSTSTRLHNTLSLLTADTPSTLLHITAYERLATGPDASPSAPLLAEVLAPTTPTLWRFTILADYPTLLAALDTLTSSPRPIVIERLTLVPSPSPSRPPTWTIEAAL